jgi:hypothetical protein
VLPFTTEEFLQVFESYNLAIYPAQWILALFAFAAVLLALRPKSFSSRFVAAILVLLWLWMAVVYHLAFFASVNDAAYLFGVLFLAQALILYIIGVTQNRLVFDPKLNIRASAGAFLIAYALLIYPAFGYLFGHIYPRSPTFGAPCPTTIFTLGLLLWTRPPAPVYVFFVPLIWSLIGFTAALKLGMFEDLGLLAAGLIAATLIFRNHVARLAA